MENLKLYSGEVFEGVCGTPTQMYDDIGNNLYVGDQVAVFVRDYPKEMPFSISYCAGILVVVEDGLNADNILKEQFIMGLKNIDFTTENEEREKWCIQKVKSYTDCVENERVPESASIRYVKS